MERNWDSGSLTLSIFTIFLFLLQIIKFFELHFTVKLGLKPIIDVSANSSGPDRDSKIKVESKKLKMSE
jgi:hypothetical protein